ncbi:MAG: efflux RND transporter permease subunit [Sphingomonadaceae bacterium]|uniref:efflux RND transporter permease subunit n=1 Tax=Thermaurantiacus sp. TaxID=2820283 RepID=UPI00298EE96A|nr:efflux RND transporter permease subunit [Thermaurantiacus sp.]MCS6987268.1 efflux RND transporter permease subunit [Sphingomonadaceae bacterium]MDW8414488.1 efflux RND transporter permease subunit [Thermaurantiacus sp.]
MDLRNLSSWAIRNPVPPLLLFLMLTLLGLLSFSRLPINQMPDVSAPLVSVTVSQPGGAPTELETQVTQKIEGAVASIGNVKSISSAVAEGASTTTVEFQIGTPVDRAVDDVRNAVSRIRSDLPEGILEPQVERIDIEGGAIAYVAVKSTAMTLEELSWFVDNTVAKRLLSIPGVAQVRRTGGVDRELRVDLYPERLQALGITAAQVNAQLRALNVDLPGGRAEVAGAEQAVRVLGGRRSAEELAETRIALPGGRFVRLGDIAFVHDGSAEQRSIARLDGRQVTSFGLFRARGSSDVEVYRRMNAELERIRADYPQVEFVELFTSTDYTEEEYRSALTALVEGALLAVLVVWLFLRDVRATVISALAIPLSAIPAFWFMELMGFTLNTVSLLALSLVAGILVDDAIVEIENIVRHMRMGKTPFQAALDAADEIGLAVVATTFAIIGVFLPVSFMPGISGQYFKQFGLTVSVAVFLSLLVARMITPLLAAYFLKPHGYRPHAEGALMQGYLRFLRWSLENRWKTVVAGAVSFLITVVLFASVPQTFSPDSDTGTSILDVELPPGATLEETARKLDEVRGFLAAQPEVASIFESIGGEGDVRRATMYIDLVPRAERDVSAKEFERRVGPELARFPDARFAFQSFGPGGGGRDIVVMLASDDPALLDATARKVEAEMRALPILRDARLDGDLERPEILIRPRYDIAAQLGVSVADLSRTVRIATMGDIEQNLAKFSLTDRQVPIRVSLVERARRDLAAIENLPVPTADGGSVPLKVVADVSFGTGPTVIRRYNQSRRVTLVADLNGVASGTAYAEINRLPTMANLPEGVRQVKFGETEVFEELVTNFVIAIVSGVILVFAVLVLLYRRVLPPFVNMGSLLLAPLGGIILIILTGNVISMPVYIGILMLLGIVAKNSILLVDFAIEEMRRGTPREDAIVEAGHKRAQPIIMTTVAMSAGMLPVALGLHGDSSFRAPMAIVVIGGLVLSTLLTLVIVPAGFTLADDLERWLGPRLARWLGMTGHHAPTLRETAQPAE